MSIYQVKSVKSLLWSANLKNDRREQHYLKRFLPITVDVARQKVVCYHAVDDDELGAPGLRVVRDDEILAAVDVRLVVEPRDLRGRLTNHNAAEHDL